MGVVCLKIPLPLKFVVIYCPHKDEKKNTAFDIKAQRHHINKNKNRKKEEKKQGTKAGNHRRKKRVQSG
jgi:hypothetical protein